MYRYIYGYKCTDIYTDINVQIYIYTDINVQLYNGYKCTDIYTDINVLKIFLFYRLTKY